MTELKSFLKVPPRVAGLQHLSIQHPHTTYYNGKRFQYKRAFHEAAALRAAGSAEDTPPDQEVSPEIRCSVDILGPFKTQLLVICLIRLFIIA